jgi:protein-S-isoprenylcysteine O-methyltransferase Ste14
MTPELASALQATALSRSGFIFSVLGAPCLSATVIQMPAPLPTNRTDRMRRWMGLILGVLLCVLLLSIYSPGQSRWIGILQVVAAAVILGLGIYEFVRHEAPKSKG